MNVRGFWRVAWGLYHSPRAAFEAAAKAWRIAGTGGVGLLALAIRRKMAHPTLPVQHLLGGSPRAAPDLPDRAYVEAPRVRPSLNESVTVIVPTKGHQEHIDACLASIARTVPLAARLDICIVNNGGPIRLPAPYPFRLSVRTERRPFNWSNYNNAAAADTDADFLLLLNDDVVAVTDGWLDQMLLAGSSAAAGPVGAMLLYPDGCIQHVGISRGPDGLPYHEHKLLRRAEFIERNGLQPFPAFAVTGACLLVRRDLFQRLGGLDARFAFSYNDVDFCRRAAAVGHASVVAPMAQLLHGESRTRPLTLDPREQGLYLTLHPSQPERN